MAMCSRPAIETQVHARRTFARCITCTRLSPPGQDEHGPWAAEHRGDAVEANAHIAERCVG